MKETKISRQKEKIIGGLDKDTVERIMNPKNDLIFKRLFGAVGRENIVKDFLEAILDVKIEEVILGEETILLPDEFNEKASVLDVKAKLENGTQVDIEMQNTQSEFIVKRSHYYASKMYTGQLKAGKDYKELKKVIVIFITNFNIFSQIENYHTVWKMTEKNNQMEHFDEMELHYIEMPKFLESKFDKKRKIDQWLLFIDYTRKELLKEIMEENEKVKEAAEDLEKMKKDEHEQYLAWAREVYLMDIEAYKETARNEGMVKGHAEGHAEGHKEGLKKGKESEKIETAKRMLKQNLDIEIIMLSTELTKEEIEKLKYE